MAKKIKTEPYVLDGKDDMQRLLQDYRYVQEEYNKLLAENLSLKRQIGGYKTSNESYKRCNKEIRSANADLGKSCIEYTETISKLRCSANEMDTTISQLKQANKILEGKAEFWEQKYNEAKKLPWYLRIFRNCF